MHPAQGADQVDSIDRGIGAVSVQTEAVILVLGLQHVAGGIQRAVVIAECRSQDDGFTGKLAVIAHNQTVCVCIESGLRNTRSAEALVFLFAADDINPKIISALPFTHNAILCKGLVPHRNSALDGVGCRVEVVHGNAHSAACKCDIGNGVDDFGLTGNIKLLIAQNSANKVGSCVTALAVQQIVVCNIGDGDVGIDGANIS